MGGRRGFNLSILECKFDAEVCDFILDSVLIYPYWNVNAVARIAVNCGARVLIYPYWNVNYCKMDV